MNQPRFLSRRSEDRDLHAVVRVTAHGVSAGRPDGPATGQAHVLVIDCSSSMSWPETKIRAARAAAVRAIGTLPPGAAFAVVAGTEQARCVYPGGTGMAIAGPDTTSEARIRLHGLVAAGGTAIGAWLDLARRLLDGRPEPVRHVTLVTDGRDEGDADVPLDPVLDACEGHFTCDAWGIGVDWDADELLRVSGRLHGSADAVRDDARLPEGVRGSVRAAGGRPLPGIHLTVTPSPGGTVRYLRQVHPVRRELVGTPVPGGGTRYLTGSWGDEERHYQLRVSADPDGLPLEEEVQAATVTAEAADGTLPPAAPAAVTVCWTDDPAPTTRIEEHAGFFDQEEALGRAIGEARGAHRRGDTRTAVRRLGDARTIAERINAVRSLAILNEMVEAVDPDGREFRMLRDLSDVDFQHLTLAGSHSSWHSGREAVPPTAAAGPSRRCPHCQASSPARARFCNACREPFAEQG